MNFLILVLLIIIGLCLLHSYVDLEDEDIHIGPYKKSYMKLPCCPEPKTTSGQPPHNQPTTAPGSTPPTQSIATSGPTATNQTTTSTTGPLPINQTTTSTTGPLPTNQTTTSTTGPLPTNQTTTTTHVPTSTNQTTTTTHVPTSTNQTTTTTYGMSAVPNNQGTTVTTSVPMPLPESKTTSTPLSTPSGHMLTTSNEITPSGLTTTTFGSPYQPQSLTTTSQPMPPGSTSHPGPLMTTSQTTLTEGDFPPLPDGEQQIQGSPIIHNPAHQRMEQMQTIQQMRGPLPPQSLNEMNEHYTTLSNFEGYTPVPLSAIEKTPSIYHNRRVIVDGVYSSGFEVSSFNGDIWVEFNPNVVMIKRPKVSRNNHSGYEKYIVKIYGIFDHVNGQGYGHLGAYKSRIIVNKIIFCQKIKI